MWEGPELDSLKFSLSVDFLSSQIMSKVKRDIDTSDDCDVIQLLLYREDRSMWQ